MKQVNTRHYAEQIAERYPDLDPASVLGLCQYVARQLYVNVAQLRYDVALQDTTRNFKVKIYKRDLDVVRANTKSRWKARRLKLRRAKWAAATTKKKIHK